MANPTIATQLRRATIVDQAARFTIDMHVTDAGDLTSKAVFVFQIVDVRDPAQDVFLGVAKIAELLSFKDSRPKAVHLGESFYRASALLRSYPALAEARAAGLFVVERVNALVTEFSTYQNDFLADPAQVFVFPEVGLGVLQPTIDAFLTTRAARIAQVALVDTMTSSCAALSEELTTAAAALVDLKAQETVVQMAGALVGNTLSRLQAVVSSQETLQNYVEQTFEAWATHAGAVADVTAKAAMDALLATSSVYHNFYYTVFDAEARKLARRVSELEQEQIDLTTAAANLAARRILLERENGSLAAKKEACTSSVVVAQAKLGALARKEVALLDEIRTLCPSYTP